MNSSAFNAIPKEGWCKLHACVAASHACLPACLCDQAATHLATAIFAGARRAVGVHCHICTNPAGGAGLADAARVGRRDWGIATGGLHKVAAAHKAQSGFIAHTVSIPGLATPHTSHYAQVLLPSTRLQLAITCCPPCCPSTHHAGSALACASVPPLVGGAASAVCQWLALAAGGAVGAGGAQLLPAAAAWLVRNAKHLHRQGSGSTQQLQGLVPEDTRPAALCKPRSMRSTHPCHPPTLPPGPLPTRIG